METGLGSGLKWRDKKLKGLVQPPPNATSFLARGWPGNPSALNDIAKWLAGGFVLLSSVLTFLGVQNGRLDRLIRNEPVGALMVFVFIGGAVTLGVVAPALDARGRVRLGLSLWLWVPYS